MAQKIMCFVFACYWSICYWAFPLPCLCRKQQVSFALRCGCALWYRLKVVDSMDDRAMLSALQSVIKESHFPGLCYSVLRSVHSAYRVLEEALRWQACQLSDCLSVPTPLPGNNASIVYKVTGLSKPNYVHIFFKLLQPKWLTSFTKLCVHTLLLKMKFKYFSHLNDILCVHPCWGGFFDQCGILMAVSQFCNCSF